MHAERNRKILALRGKKSFGLIARELGVTRNVVAGVCWREDWPLETRVPSPGHRGGNKCGLGRHMQRGQTPKLNRLTVNN